MIRRSLFFLILLGISCIFPFSLSASTSLEDSLKALVPIAKRQDKVDVLNQLSAYYLQKVPDSSFFYAQEALHESEKLGYQAGIALSHYWVAKYYSNQSYPEKSIKHFKEALMHERYFVQHPEQHRDALELLCEMYMRAGRMTDAIEVGMQALHACEQSNDETGISRSLQDLVNAYISIENYYKAREYVTKALALDSTRKNHIAIAMDYNALGAIYHKEKRHERALYYFEMASRLLDSLGAERDLRGIKSNIGEVYKIQKDYYAALTFYWESYELHKKYADIGGMCLNLRRISDIHILKSEWEKALTYEQEALKLAEGRQLKSELPEIYKAISSIYEAMGDTQKALHYAWKYAKMKDQLYQENSRSRLNEMESRYELEQKERQISLLTKDNKLREAKVKQEEMVINFLLVGFLLILILSFVLYRRNQEKQRANHLLAEQKNEIEAKNEELQEMNNAIQLQKEEIEGQHQVLVLQKGEIEKQNRKLENARDELNLLVSTLNETNSKLELTYHQITSSINYAKRIQDAMLPNIQRIRTLIPDSFIFFRPRDIVSGDFYWFHEQDQKIYLAAADCTGHGVPGAFMAMMGEAFLSQLIGSLHLSSPAKILDTLHSNIRKSLKQDVTQNRDGMDITICIIDLQNRTLKFAGANNPLVFIQDGEIHRIKGDRSGIGGKVADASFRFSDHTFLLDKPTTFYIFSDGYQDQFGGENGMKFLSRRFRDLLHEISYHDVDMQETILKTTLEEWMGEEHKQIDDILVMGFKIDPDKLFKKETKIVSDFTSM